MKHKRPTDRLLLAVMASLARPNERALVTSTALMQITGLSRSTIWRVTRALYKSGALESDYRKPKGIREMRYWYLAEHTAHEFEKLIDYSHTTGAYIIQPALIAWRYADPE